jgi:hypothetical protein
MLWPPSFREEVQAELDRLDNELRLRQSRLLRCRQQLEKLRGRVEKSERQRTRLQAAERAYDHLRVRLQRRKEKRKELHTLLLSASDGRAAGNYEEEMDFDYPF